ncbi:MAG: hypothetical protein NDI94_04410, partial [Candidatus Woesearchaeota archaeon]|nr:hypothetical protein [Candidatus Woesearchaeota archaeon]
MRFFPLFISLLLISSALAHEEVEEKTLDHKLRDNSVFLISYGSLAILLSIGISFFIHSRHHHWPYFLVAAITILITSYLVIATINLNLVSETKGPVHWHADFEIYNCGEKLDLIDPKGLSNKIGTPVFHEHNDDRMHVEGVVVEEEHVSLSEFIETIGGELTADSMKIETNDGVVVMNNGDICGGE